MKPEDIHIGAMVRISKREYEDDPKLWDSRIETRLIDKVAARLTRDRCETITTNNMIEKSVDLYVASPEVFWKIVEEEARRIAFNFKMGG